MKSRNSSNTALVWTLSLFFTLIGVGSAVLYRVHRDEAIRRQPLAEVTLPSGLHMAASCYLRRDDGTCVGIQVTTNVKLNDGLAISDGPKSPNLTVNDIFAAVKDTGVSGMVSVEDFTVSYHPSELDTPKVSADKVLTALTTVLQSRGAGT